MIDTCTCIQHICNLSMIQSTLDEKTCLHHNSCTLSYSHHSSAMSTDDHFRTRLFVGSLLGWFLCTRQKWQPSWGINIASSRVIKRIFHMIYIILTFTKSNRTRNYIFFLSIFRGDQCTVSRIYSNVLNYKEDFFFLESNEYFSISRRKWNWWCCQRRISLGQMGKSNGILTRIILFFQIINIDVISNVISRSYFHTKKIKDILTIVIEKKMYSRSFAPTLRYTPIW